MAPDLQAWRCTCFGNVWTLVALTTISPLSSDLAASAASAAAKASLSARSKSDATFTLPDDVTAPASQTDSRTGTTTAYPANQTATDAPPAPAKDASAATDTTATDAPKKDEAKKDDPKKDDAKTGDAQSADGKAVPTVVVIPVGATAGAGADVAQAVAAAAAGTQPGAAAPNTSATKAANLVVGSSATTTPATAIATLATQPAQAAASVAADAKPTTLTTDKPAKATPDTAATKASLSSTATAATSDDKPKTASPTEAPVKTVDPVNHFAATQAQASPDAAAAALAQQQNQQQAAAATNAAATTAATTAATAQTATTLPTATIQTVPIEIGMQALKNGSSTFDIRLDPADLGKVQVKLKISDGNVSASLVVDRVETLQMLQRESKTLERAFEQAGLKSNPDDLQFSLRQDSSRQQNQSGGEQQQAQGRAVPSDDADLPALPANVAIQRILQNRAYASGVDIQI